MMSKLNHIGLSTKESKQLANDLNDLLANYQIFYQNTRGFHWNIKGLKFFELHLKFEELYNNLQIKIDEVAERILTLGHVPLHAFTDYVSTATVKEQKGISDGVEAVNSILTSFKVIIAKQRNILGLSAQADDEGTNALMSDYIREQEKLVWMYSSFLS